MMPGYRDPRKAARAILAALAVAAIVGGAMLLTAHDGENRDAVKIYGGVK